MTLSALAREASPTTAQAAARARDELTSILPLAGQIVARCTHCFAWHGPRLGKVVGRGDAALHRGLRKEQGTKMG
eukprot:3790612-Prymnesium_polylepis.2